MVLFWVYGQWVAMCDLHQASRALLWPLAPLMGFAATEEQPPAPFQTSSFYFTWFSWVITPKGEGRLRML